MTSSQPSGSGRDASSIARRREPGDAQPRSPRHTGKRMRCSSRSHSESGTGRREDGDEVVSPRKKKEWQGRRSPNHSFTSAYAVKVRADCTRLLQRSFDQSKQGYNPAVLKAAFQGQFGYELDYKAAGFPKLSMFLEAMPDVVRIETNPNTRQPLLYPSKAPFNPSRTSEPQRDMKHPSSKIPLSFAQQLTADLQVLLHENKGYHVEELLKPKFHRRFGYALDYQAAGFLSFTALLDTMPELIEIGTASKGHKGMPQQCNPPPAMVPKCRDSIGGSRHFSNRHETRDKTHFTSSRATRGRSSHSRSPTSSEQRHTRHWAQHWQSVTPRARHISENPSCNDSHETTDNTLFQSKRGTGGRSLHSTSPTCSESRHRRHRQSVSPRGRSVCRHTSDYPGCMRKPPRLVESLETRNKVAQSPNVSLGREEHHGSYLSRSTTSASTHSRGEFDRPNATQEPNTFSSISKVKIPVSGVSVRASPDVELCAPLERKAGDGCSPDITRMISPARKPLVESESLNSFPPLVVIGRLAVGSGSPSSLPEVQFATESESDPAGMHPIESTRINIPTAVKSCFSTDKRTSGQQTEEDVDWLTLTVRPPPKPCVQLPDGLGGRDLTLGLSGPVVPKLFGVELYWDTTCQPEVCKMVERAACLDLVPPSNPYLSATDVEKWAPKSVDVGNESATNEEIDQRPVCIWRERGVGCSSSLLSPALPLAAGVGSLSMISCIEEESADRLPEELPLCAGPGVQDSNIPHVSDLLRSLNQASLSQHEAPSCSLWSPSNGTPGEPLHSSQSRVLASFLTGESVDEDNSSSKCDSAKEKQGPPPSHESRSSMEVSFSQDQAASPVHAPLTLVSQPKRSLPTGQKSSPQLKYGLKSCSPLVAHMDKFPDRSEESSPTEYTSPEPSNGAVGSPDEVVDSQSKQMLESGRASPAKRASVAHRSPPVALLNAGNPICCEGRLHQGLDKGVSMGYPNPSSSRGNSSGSSSDKGLPCEEATADSKPDPPLRWSPGIAAMNSLSVPSAPRPRLSKYKMWSFAGSEPGAGSSSKGLPSSMNHRQTEPCHYVEAMPSNLEWTSTRHKERYEEDKCGNLRVVVDLVDSDNEAAEGHLVDGMVKGRAQQNVQWQVPQSGKEGDVKVLPAAKTASFVDLSDSGSQTSDSEDHCRTFEIQQFAADLVARGRRGKDVAVKASEREEEEVIVGPLIHQGLPIEVRVGSPHSLGEEKLAVPICPSPSTSRRSNRKVRRLIIDEDEEVETPRTLAPIPESDEEASTLSGNYVRKQADEVEEDLVCPDWTPGIKCDMCDKGPSLSLGGWYSWCCGEPTQDCTCSLEEQAMKKKLLKWKGGKKWTKKDPPYLWSGKVHRLCALWSCEVYEGDGSLRMEMQMSAVQRSQKIKCSDPECRGYGATLGCRVRRCRKNFHYPCVDKLAATLRVRMWEGVKLPIACEAHRHVDKSCLDAKSCPVKKKKSLKSGSGVEGVRGFEQEPKGLEIREKKRRKHEVVVVGSKGSMPEQRASTGVPVVDLSEDRSPVCQPHAQCQVSNSSRPPSAVSAHFCSQRGRSEVEVMDTPNRRQEPLPNYLGKKLLCMDFSGGREAVIIPCTNDVDEEPVPMLEYITQCRYQGLPVGCRAGEHLPVKKLAKACDGCAKFDLDDPAAPISVHVPFQHREEDDREDWQKERMHGRLPYDRHARLLVGSDYNELVECNSRCGCGAECINSEMQKGLRIPLEMYKTNNKGWAVRTLEDIPRGRFVIEYVGEMLNQAEAHERGLKYDEIKRSYLYDLDYPESKRKPIFTLDGFHASNVARFINHSCDANLKIYRVYTETTCKWLFHIGMYAMRDIEAGEELSYDYNYGKRLDRNMHEDGTDMDYVQRECQLNSFPELGENNEIDSTHIKCYCGAKGCRQWLWKPCYVESDTEGEAETEGQRERRGNMLGLAASLKAC